MVYENLLSERDLRQTSAKTFSPDAIRDFIIGCLLVTLIGAWGYIIYDKDKSYETTAQKDSFLSSVLQERDNLQKEVDNAALRYDELKTENAKKEMSILEKEREIAEKKNRIRALLSIAHK